MSQKIDKFFTKVPATGATASDDAKTNSANGETQPEPETCNEEVGVHDLQCKKIRLNTKKIKINDDVPYQPNNINFPVDANKRKFLPCWFSTFPWLEWSTELNAAFCFACRKIYELESKSVCKTTITSTRTDDAFTVTGFRNWKKASDLKFTSLVSHIVLT